MADYPILKNSGYTIPPFPLVDSSNRPDFKSSPTLAEGDFKVSIDGGALNNLDTLPTVSPAGSTLIKIVLSSDEMNGDIISVVCIDAAGEEWDDVSIGIQTGAVLLGSLSDFDETTDPVELLDTGGTAGTSASELINDVWDEEVTLGHIAADSAGYELQNNNITHWLGTAVPSLDSAAIIESVSATTITKYRGDYWSIVITGLGSITGNTKVWFSVKEKSSGSENDAIIRITDTVGLERINKGTATAGNGTLTVDDAGDGDITITLEAVETAKLSPISYVYDIQWLNAAGEPTTIAAGIFVISADVSLATD